jgi:hypothetical protein
MCLEFQDLSFCHQLVISLVNIKIGRRSHKLLTFYSAPQRMNSCRFCLLQKAIYSSGKPNPLPVSNLNYRIPVVDFPPSYSPHGDDGADELKSALLMPLVSGTLRMRKIRLAHVDFENVVTASRNSCRLHSSGFLQGYYNKVPERRP